MAIKMASSLSSSLGQVAPRYCVKYLNPDGTILRTKPISAAGDKEAIEYAKRLMDGRALEVWDADRLVDIIPVVAEAQEGTELL